MDKCINTKHPEFIELAKQANMNPLVLKSKIGVWQEKNNSDDFPTLEELRIGQEAPIADIKEGVSELFESNPTLANAVYEALGFKTKADVILPIGTSGSGKSTFIKSLPQENLVVIEPDAMRVEFTGDMNNKSKDKEIYEEAANRAIQAIKQGKQVVFDTTNLTKNKRLPFIEAIKKAIPTANIQYKLMELNPELAKQRIKAQLARGENRAAVSDETIDRHAASYKQMLEDIKNEPISNFEITPQQKQKAQQLYSQYLDTVFPDSKVKDIVYHGSRNKEKVLEEGFKPRMKDDLIYFTYKDTSSFINKDKSNLITVIVNLKNPIDNEAEFSVFGEEKNVDGYYDRTLETKNVEQLGVKTPEQIHILGSKQDIEGFKSWVDSNQSNVLYQLPQGREIEEFVASEKTIRDLAARMSYRIGIPVVFESDRSEEYKGKLENGTAVVNLAYATLDTPIHEILGHPIIRAIKNKKGEHFNTWLQKTKPELFKRFSDKEFDFYSDVNKEFEDFILEITPNYIGEYKEYLDNKQQLYQNLLKELEYGKGKEVFDRIKRDYVFKKEIPYMSIIKKDTTVLYYDKNTKTGYIHDNSNPNERKTFNSEQEIRDYLELNDKYTLEEQQEEALVELLGLMTAEKLDKVKDGKLISLLKRLLKEMKAFMKQLLGQKEVEIDKLPDNMTLGDIADLLAYSNSKLILPGYEVIYTTPDNQQFKTYAEASKHISQLAKSVEDVDLSDTSIIKESLTIEEEAELNNLEQIKNSTGFNLKEERKRYKELYYRKYGDVKDFIEKNKEYEQSKEIIEEWKKVNNIQYNPEEVYSRGQEFVSVLGAYSDFDVNLMMQNLLQHIEDNQKAGGEFTISAFTKPVDKQIGHLEGGGGKIKFKIYPQSKDIKWAANTDVFSGSVWDASEKVNKDKKSELLGVSYTKYPSLRHVNVVQPNLASIIDNLANHHNELGISLTGSNFRLEYDENIPYSTKKLINSINSILDQKYGKLVKPEIKEPKEKRRKTYSVYYKGNNNEQFRANSEREANEFIQKHSKIWKIDISEYYLKDSFVVEGYEGIQPTQTNETLKESIESVKDRVYIDDSNYELLLRSYNQAKEGIVPEHYSAYTDLQGKLDKKIHVMALSEEITKGEQAIGMWQTDEDYDTIKNYIVGEAENKHGVKFWILSNEFKTEALSSYKKPIKSEKEYTEQALINAKIAKLKEVAKIYPRSLIISEVRPIRSNSNLGFAGDELPFQKAFAEGNKIKKGVQELFESNPELASIGNQQQYSQYLDTIFPDSKVKDIVYHYTDAKKFDKFIKDYIGSSVERTRVNAADSELGIFFGKKGLEGVVNKEKLGTTEIPALINIKNPNNDIYDKADEYLYSSERFIDEQKPDYDIELEEDENGNIKNVYKEKDKLKGKDLERAWYNSYKKDLIAQGKDGVVLDNIKIVFEPEQIHILGSKEDLEGFKEFIKGSNNSSQQSQQSLAPKTLEELGRVSLQEAYGTHTDESLISTAFSKEYLVDLEIFSSYFNDTFPFQDYIKANPIEVQLSKKRELSDNGRSYNAYYSLDKKRVFVGRGATEKDLFSAILEYYLLENEDIDVQDILFDMVDKINSRDNNFKVYSTDDIIHNLFINEKMKDFLKTQESNMEEYKNLFDEFVSIVAEKGNLKKQEVLDILERYSKIEVAEAKSIDEISKDYPDVFSMQVLNNIEKC